MSLRALPNYLATAVALEATSLGLESRALPLDDTAA